mgnify:CR=1 FL=1
MLIKLTYEMKTLDKEVRCFGDSLFDEISERHVKQTYTSDGKRIVEIDFKDKNGIDRSFYVTGTAYIMSDSGKTIDTIQGGVVPEGVSCDYGDAVFGLIPYPCEEPTEIAILQEATAE